MMCYLTGFAPVWQQCLSYLVLQADIRSWLWHSRNCLHEVPKMHAAAHNYAGELTQAPKNGRALGRSPPIYTTFWIQQTMSVQFCEPAAPPPLRPGVAS